MTSIRLTLCPHCRKAPTCYAVESSHCLFGVTCMDCRGILALGNTEDEAKICWNNSVARESTGRDL